MHYTSVEARKHADARQLLDAEGARLAEAEQRLTRVLEDRTALIYEAQVGEDERLERLLFLGRQTSLHGIERDTTYYFRDSQHRLEPSASKSTSRPTKASPLLKRVQTGRETRLEKELTLETRVVNDLKKAIHRCLDAVEARAQSHTEAFDADTAQLRAAARGLVDEAMRVDLQSYHTVTELLSLRLKIMRIQREELEDSERLEREIEYYSARETAVHMQLNNEVTEMNRRCERDMADSMREYQAQLQALSAEEARLEQRAGAAAEEQGGASEDLAQELAAAKTRYEKLRRRNQLEMEGFSAESTALRQRLLSIERQHKAATKK